MLVHTITLCVSVAACGHLSSQFFVKCGAFFVLTKDAIRQVLLPRFKVVELLLFKEYSMPQGSPGKW